MYAKCGDAAAANAVFYAAADKDLVSWNALLAAYSQSGHCDRTLQLFDRMLSAGLKPDSATMVSALSACSSLGFLRRGKKIHRAIAEENLQLNLALKNALLDMYAKCGSMSDAIHLFDEMSERNVISWSTMIAGYAINGDGTQALAMAERMREEGVEPNHVTHLAVLSACVHAGLVSHGRNYFSSIAKPTVEHFACMVDLLARSGKIDEAYSLVVDMPLEPDAGVWGALLSACVVHHRIDIGTVAADSLLVLAPSSPSYQVLVSNMYAMAGRWRDVETVRKNMRKNRLRKVAAYCAVETGEGGVEMFYSGDWRSEELKKKLEELLNACRENGYRFEGEAVFHDVEEEEKEVAVGAHCEKIAIAYALLVRSDDGNEVGIRVMKNLRTCGDCHEFARIVSEVMRVEIVVRDKSRFHHFKRGSCSCQGFW